MIPCFLGAQPNSRLSFWVDVPTMDDELSVYSQTEQPFFLWGMMTESSSVVRRWLSYIRKEILSFKLSLQKKERL